MKHYVDSLEQQHLQPQDPIMTFFLLKSSEAIDVHSIKKLTCRLSSDSWIEGCATQERQLPSCARTISAKQEQHPHRCHPWKEHLRLVMAQLDAAMQPWGNKTTLGTQKQTTFCPQQLSHKEKTVRRKQAPSGSARWDEPPADSDHAERHPLLPTTSYLVLPATQPMQGKSPADADIQGWVIRRFEK
eukprot:1160389-Pelagomonas_calceolata.AAC.1